MNPNAAALPAAMNNLAQRVASASASVSTSIEAPIVARPKRAAAAAAAAIFGVEAEAAPVKLLPPSPPRVTKKPRGAMNVKGTAAFVAMETTAMSLVAELRDCEGARAADQHRLGEVMAHNGDLLGERRSRLSMQSAQSARKSDLKAVFDPLNVTPFDLESDAGRKPLSRAMESLNSCLKGLCPQYVVRP